LTRIKPSAATIALVLRVEKSEPEGRVRYRYLLSLCVVSLAWFAGASDAYAGRYCLQGHPWGYPGDCSFSTYSQCAAPAAGTNAHCGINPRYAHHRRVQGH
jgi:Protein of unknown function (DUF3551)